MPDLKVPHRTQPPDGARYHMPKPSGSLRNSLGDAVTSHPPPGVGHVKPNTGGRKSGLAAGPSTWATSGVVTDACGVVPAVVGWAGAAPAGASSENVPATNLEIDGPSANT